MKFPIVNRRFFLWTGVSALGLGLGLVLWNRTKAHYHPQAYALTQLMGDSCQGVQAGHAYLQEHPEEADLDLLPGLIFPAGFPEECSQDALRQRYQRQVATDFEEDRTVTVVSWVLSRSEARALAVAALWHSWID